jgi:hypothetical protein
METAVKLLQRYLSQKYGIKDNYSVIYNTVFLYPLYYSRRPNNVLLTALDTGKPFSPLKIHENDRIIFSLRSFK